MIVKISLSSFFYFFELLTNDVAKVHKKVKVFTIFFKKSKSFYYLIKRNLTDN